MPEPWRCPKCKRTVVDYPAITRDESVDYREICSSCGRNEAMEAFVKYEQMTLLEDDEEGIRNIIR